MKLEFKVYQLKESSILYDRAIKKGNKPNEFIIVGEEKLRDNFDCYKAHQLGENGFIIIGGLNINEFSMLIPKDDLIPTPGIGVEITEIDIPKQYLTMQIIEDIQRLNN